MTIKKGTCLLIDVAVPGDRNVIWIEAVEILKYTVYWLHNRKSAHVEGESKSDTSNNRNDDDEE